MSEKQEILRYIKFLSIITQPFTAYCGKLCLLKFYHEKFSGMRIESIVL